VDDRLKRRLIGAAVLASLAVIFVPMLIEDEPVPDGAPAGTVPPREGLTFRSQVLKDEIAVPTDAPPPAAGAEPQAEPPADAPQELTQEPPLEPAPEATAAPAPPPLPPAEPAPPPEKPKAPPAPVAKATPPPKPPAAPAPRITTWIVQVGNFSTRDKADAVARQLRGKGLEVFIEPIGTPPVFRVAVGPESERKRAEALIPRVEATVPGGSKPFIRTYP
jgi:DedD protein